MRKPMYAVFKTSGRGASTCAGVFDNEAHATSVVSDLRPRYPDVHWLQVSREYGQQLLAHRKTASARERGEITGTLTLGLTSQRCVNAPRKAFTQAPPKMRTVDRLRVFGGSLEYDGERESWVICKAGRRVVVKKNSKVTLTLFDHPPETIIAVLELLDAISIPRAPAHTRVANEVPETN
jgi:hypothetical protein